MCPSSTRGTLRERFVDETKVEWRLLKSKWWILCLGAAFQYVHGMFTAVAYHMHEPQKQPLKDLGFMILPELGERFDWIGEDVFWTLFISFLVFAFTPFIRRKPKFFTVLLFSRFLCILCTCQSLRILSFLSTGLPGPAPHCRLGKSTASLAWPQHWWQNIFFDIGTQAAHSCGDLLFSSHTTFILIGAYTYTVYGSRRLIKAAVWLAVACICCLIIASRKHYTVDVVVAWYVVPLVFFTWKRFWNQHRVGDGQEPDWLPVTGTTAKGESDDELSDIVVTSSNGNSSYFVEMTPSARAAYLCAGATSQINGSAVINYKQQQPKRSSSGGSSNGSPGSDNGAPARLSKFISSPPPERTVVVSEGSSTSVLPRGSAVTNRGQGPSSTGWRFSSQPDESMYPVYDEEADASTMTNVSLE